MFLTGNHQRTLDDANRIQIPADYRTEIGGDPDKLALYVTPGPFQKTLSIYTRESIEALHHRISVYTQKDPKAYNFDLAFWSFAPRVPVDKQGRLVLPANLLEERNMQKDTSLTLAGQVDHIDVWRSDEFEQYTKELKEQWPVLQSFLRGGPQPVERN